MEVVRHVAHVQISVSVIELILRNIKITVSKFVGKRVSSFACSKSIFESLFLWIPHRKEGGFACLQYDYNKRR